MSSSRPAPDPTFDDVPIVLLPAGVDVERLLAEIDAEAKAVAAAPPATKLPAVERPRPAPRPATRPAPTAEPVAPRIVEPPIAIPDPIPVLTELGEPLAQAIPVGGPSLADIAEEIDGEIADEIRVTSGRAGISPSRIGLAAAWICVAALGLLLIAGLPYYRLGIGPRTFHHLHAALRPSGTIGLSLGLVGTLVMLLGLSYLVRKALVKRVRSTTLPGWLRFHIVAGLVGPALVLFHTAFRPTSAMGLAALVALAVVVASGVLGRYLLVLVPRTFQGRELELSVVQQRLVVYRQKLELLGLRPRRLESSVGVAHGPRLFGFGIALVRVFYGDWQDRREFKNLKASLRTRHVARDEARRIRILFRRLHRERQWLVRSRELRQLVGAWRFGHRWFTVVLLAAVAFHVGIALRYGGLWILGGGGR
ncbi:MAG: hypothetical protein AB7O52_08560 [Planctomycetota bacterium]